VQIKLDPFFLSRMESEARHDDISVDLEAAFTCFAVFVFYTAGRRGTINRRRNRCRPGISEINLH
jgi:hypothetical protein